METTPKGPINLLESDYPIFQNKRPKEAIGMGDREQSSSRIDKKVIKKITRKVKEHVRERSLSLASDTDYKTKDQIGTKHIHEINTAMTSMTKK